MDKTMDYYNCYSPLCPRRETCILWLNALECVERGENLLCVINPKILEAAGGYDHCPPLLRVQTQTIRSGFDLELSGDNYCPTGGPSFRSH